MSEKTYVGSRIRSFRVSPELDSFTKVVINVSDDLCYEAGTDTGRTLTLECPWGSQEMADDLVKSLSGFHYQPYTGRGAALDPAAELGDGITVRDTYSGLYSRKTRFGRLHLSDIAAPTEEEIDHEFPYLPRQERKVTRRLSDLTAELKVQAGLISAEVEERRSETEALKAALTVQAGKISAKVDSEYYSESLTFGWNLTDRSFEIFSGGGAVVQVTEENGLWVNGKITATSGTIGGFDILSDRLSYNSMDWNGTNTNGVYLGPKGIQLGRNFKVDSAGNLQAASGTFSGNVYAGNIKSGGDYGKFDGGGLVSGSVHGGEGGAIARESVTTFNTTGGIKDSLGNADFAAGIFRGLQDFRALNGNTIIIKRNLNFHGKYFELKTINYKMANGDNGLLQVVCWRDTQPYEGS